MATHCKDFNLEFTCLGEYLERSRSSLLSVVDERDERCQRNIPVILAILTELVILQYL